MNSKMGSAIWRIILCKGEMPEQRQEDEEKRGKGIGIEVTVRYHRELGDRSLMSLDFISNATRSHWRVVLNEGNWDTGGGRK